MKQSTNVVSITGVGSISVSRETLMSSGSALQNLGKVHVPIEQASYWMTKTLGKVQTAFKQIIKEQRAESNRLVELHGEFLKDAEGNETKQKGIQQSDAARMKLYNDDMEAFMSEQIVIENVKSIKVSDLKAANASLTLGDQVALDWLIVED